MLRPQKLTPPEVCRQIDGLRLPFGYYVECDPDLLIVRRSDGAFVAAFSIGNADPFEVELTVWEDAD
jgi:hypothetical protein